MPPIRRTLGVDRGHGPLLPENPQPAATPAVLSVGATSPRRSRPEGPVSDPER